MAVFADSAVLYSVLGPFFEALAAHPDVGPKLLDSKLKLRFRYRQPEAAIAVDLSGERAVIFAPAPEDFAPDIDMAMPADVAHRFWQGQVNLITALARREITAKGPIPKILKLLPLIKPAYALYGPFLRKIGFEK